MYRATLFCHGTVGAEWQGNTTLRNSTCIFLNRTKFVTTSKALLIVNKNDTLLLARIMEFEENKFSSADTIVDLDGRLQITTNKLPVFLYES